MGPDDIGPRGIVPSLNTPFTPDGVLDLAGVGRAVDYIVEAGCAGILMLAVAGETASLSMAEKSQRLDSVCGRAARRIPVIAGVTAPSWPDSLDVAARAAACGAFAVLWQPSRDLSETELESGLRDLAEAGPGRVMLQDLDWHGGGIPVATLCALFEKVPGFFAVKVETVLAGPKYSALLAATEGRLHVSGGWAVGEMMDALARGVHAFMPTAMEPLYCRVVRLYRAGREQEARALFETLLPVLAFANQHIDVSIRFFKMLRAREGVFASDFCRPPVAELDTVQRAEAERLIDYALDGLRRLHGTP